MRDRSAKSRPGRQFRTLLQRTRVRYFVLAWLAASILFLAATSWTDSQTVARHEKNFSAQQALLVSLASDAMGRHLAALVESARHLAARQLSELAWTEDNLDALRFEFERQLSAHPDTRAYVLFDRDARPLRAAAVKVPTGVVARQVAAQWADASRADWRTTSGSPLVPAFHITEDHQFAGLLFPVGRTEPRGLLAVVVDLNALSSRYVAPMRLGHQGAGYILDGVGNVVYDRQTELIGHNVFDRRGRQAPEVLKIDRRLLKEPEGTGEYRPTAVGGEAASRNLVAWQSLALGAQKLIIALSAPDVEINEILVELRRQQVLMGGLFFLVFLMSSAFFFRYRLTALATTANALRGDVAERTAELAKSEHKYRTLVEGSVQGILVHKDFRPLFVNERWARMFGYDGPGEILRMDTILPLYPPSARRELRAMNDALMGGTVELSSREMEGLRRNGSIVWLDCKSTMVTWRGEPAVQITTFDISDRKRAQDALGKSEAKLDAILRTAANAIVTVDEEGAINVFSPTAEAMFGYDADEIIGRNIGELLSDVPRHRPLATVDEEDREEGRKSGSVEYEAQGRRKDGSTFPIDIAVGEWHLEGQRFFTTVIRDATRRKAVEEQLRQAQKMEAVGQLTGGVAHDFNNHLAVILGNLELLRERLDGGTDADGYAQRAIGAANRGAALTQRLLAFSRRQVLQPQRVDVNAAIRGLLDLLGHSLGATIEIQTSLAPGLWQTRIDPNQLESALLNLAINARDAMPKGGRLLIETANAHLDEDYAAAPAGVPAGEYVSLTITDTGKGMDKEVLGHVFEPFFTTKAFGKGTGLGLSMVYGFVKQSGGHVSIYSEPGEGTLVRLYLPREQGEYASDAAADADAGDIPPGSGEAVLLVEDDPDVRALAARQLIDLGYTVKQARTGEDALRHLRSDGEVRLLLTDMVLPGGLGGRELAEQIRRIRPDCRVLYMSGYTDAEIFARGKLAEGVVLLQKPFRKLDLARKVRVALDG